MITNQLISPKSIAIIGGSQDTSKPGGNALKNLIDTKYSGDLYVVNPKSNLVQGIKSYPTISQLPDVDCAILAIPAKMCPQSVLELCRDKNCNAIIIFSAGFHEDSHEGALLEKEIVEIVNKYNASLIGPNCIGVITPNYAGVFTHPISNLSKNGVDIISGSGATVVFIMEAAIKLGINFSHIFSVGNSAQLGVEDILEYLDESYIHGESSLVKLLYIESITNPKKLEKHAKSLIAKGARIAAIKSGYSEAGSRAASSHTGALASPDNAVTNLFKKCGIIRAYSREELVNIAAILSFPKPKGNKIAIVTHAGGPAVMLTDVLNSSGVEIPHISGNKADELLTKLYPGSSVNNPIDFLATGTAQQLSYIIDACNNDFDVDSMAVIFGSPGLTDVTDVYQVVLDKIKESKKPIYPIFPSVINAKESIEKYQQGGGICFTEEVSFGKAFIKMMNTNPKKISNNILQIDRIKIRELIDSADNGYLSPDLVQKLLDYAGINRVKEYIVTNITNAKEVAKEIGYPMVMKVVGPVHKSDIGGVALNISSIEEMQAEYNRMITLPNVIGVLMQPMLRGTEIFIGAKKEGEFGTTIMCGLGGIFIEVIKDVCSTLTPVDYAEAIEMIKSLKGYKIIEGIRGKEGVNIDKFADAIVRISALCSVAPEIVEMDINPLLGNKDYVVAVDARICINR